MNVDKENRFFRDLVYNLETVLDTPKLDVVE